MNYMNYFSKKHKTQTKSAALYWPGGGCSLWCCGDDFSKFAENIEMKII